VECRKDADVLDETPGAYKPIVPHVPGEHHRGMKILARRGMLRGERAGRSEVAAVLVLRARP
jgi:hypothetical protein